MLIINKDQMKAFDDAALLRFEHEMMVHSHRFTPQLCEVLGKEQLRIALRQAIHRAITYGFTNRGPIRLYIELMFLFGSDFDTDPQYLRIAEVLQSSADQMERAEVIYNIVLEYQEEVSGPDAENLYRGLKAISAQAREPDSFSKKNSRNRCCLKSLIRQAGQGGWKKERRLGLIRYLPDHGKEKRHEQGPQTHTSQCRWRGQIRHRQFCCNLPH